MIVHSAQVYMQIITTAGQWFILQLLHRQTDQISKEDLTSLGQNDDHFWILFRWLYWK